MSCKNARNEIYIRAPPGCHVGCEKNSIDVVQLYGCSAQGTLYLYSEDIMITTCIRLLVVFYIDSRVGYNVYLEYNTTCIY
jgi:hypothetical protein